MTSLEKKCLYSKEHLWDLKPEWKLFPGLECSVSFCGGDLSSGDPEHCGPFPPFSFVFVLFPVLLWPWVSYGSIHCYHIYRRKEGKEGKRVRKKREGGKEGGRMGGKEEEEGGRKRGRTMATVV